MLAAVASIMVAQGSTDVIQSLSLFDAIRLGVASIPALFFLIFIAAVSGPILLLHALRWTPLLSMASTGERGPPRDRKLFRANAGKTRPAAAPVQ